MVGYESSTVVHAPIDVVWSVLVDVERMPQWTSSMKAIQLLKGTVLHRGSRVRIQQPWLWPATWTVDLLDPPRYFSWRAQTGLVETVGGHLLEDRGAATFVTLSIQHSGRTAWLVAKLTSPLTRRYVDRELAGLKQQSEQWAGRQGAR